MRTGTRQWPGRRLSAVLLALLAGIVLLCAAAIRTRSLLYETLDGRRARAVRQTYLPEFELRAQMYSRQALAKVSGWLTVADQREVTLNVDGGMRFAREFAPVHSDEYAPWALLLHGGRGTDGTQLMDMACELSLAGYRVLLPDLRAHGRSEGNLITLGMLESEDVIGWVEWISMRSGGNRIVIAAKDEGAAAALLAAKKLEGKVLAIAADSAYADVQARAEGLLMEADARTGDLDRWLFRLGFSALFGSRGTDVLEAARDIGIPLLVIHGTADEDVPAWHGEDIAASAGENARLLLMEGALHGMGRFADPKAYYSVLLGFFEEAL